MGPPRRLVLGLALVAASATGCGHRASGVLATVNGRTISRADFERELGRRNGAVELRDLIDQAIVQQAAARQGIRLDPNRVQAALAEQQAEAGGPKQLEERLAREGRTLEALRNSLAEKALADQVIAAQVTVGDDEVRRYYDTHRKDFGHGELVKARLILLESRANAEALAKALAEPGADFAGLAKALSVDPGTKDKGGDMGWIERKDYAPPIAGAAFALRPGQRSGIIEYPDGFAIVQVEDRRPGGVRPLDEVRPSIVAILARQKQAALQPKWVVDQRRKAQVKVFDRRLRQAYALVKDQ